MQAPGSGLGASALRFPREENKGLIIIMYKDRSCCFYVIKYMKWV